MGARLIHKYSLRALQGWNRGDYQVQVMVPGNDHPVAYCDGTDEDIEALRAIAREEGTELADINRRILKTGREIWTIGEPPTQPTGDQQSDG